MVKEPYTMKLTPWHADMPYYFVNGKQTVSMWIPLEPVDKKTSLKFIAGSHLWEKMIRPVSWADDSDFYDDSNNHNNVNINMLPLNITQIDSVEIISVPQIYNGIFTDYGLIHIHTKSISNGKSMTFFQSAGNETGDPGPYVYTKYKSPKKYFWRFNSNFSFFNIFLTSIFLVRHNLLKRRFRVFKNI